MFGKVCSCWAVREQVSSHEILAKMHNCDSRFIKEVPRSWTDSQNEYAPVTPTLKLNRDLFETLYGSGLVQRPR